MLTLSNRVVIPAEEIDMAAIRSRGAGGQNVNKVSSAIHLRFDIRASSLPDGCKERLLALGDQRINKDGVIVIKAQQFRTQEKNRADALERLRQILLPALNYQPKARRPTRPSKSARRKRVDHKVKRGQAKSLRGRVRADTEH